MAINDKAFQLTRDEVLRMAREAGITWEPITNFAPPLERFAALVAATATRKQHIDALVGDRLTAQKADHICERDGYAVTGVVLTLQDGRACIVNQSAVRWLSGVRDLWNLMHTNSLDNVRMVAEAVAVEREACAKVCDELHDQWRWGDDDTISGPSECAAAIRARGKAPYTCRYCGRPSWLEPVDQSPPPDYCHDSDHGMPS